MMYKQVEALTESTGERRRWANLDGRDGAGVHHLSERAANDSAGHEAKDRAATGGLGLRRRRPHCEPAGAPAGRAWETHSLR